MLTMQVINEKALMSVGGPLPGAVVIFSKGEKGESLDENGKQPPPPEDPFQRIALGMLPAQSSEGPFLVSHIVSKPLHKPVTRVPSARQQICLGLMSVCSR